MQRKSKKHLLKEKRESKKNHPELYARIRAQGFDVGDSLEDMADAKLRKKQQEKSDGK